MDAATQAVWDELRKDTEYQSKEGAALDADMAYKQYKFELGEKYKNHDPEWPSVGSESLVQRVGIYPHTRNVKITAEERDMLEEKRMDVPLPAAKCSSYMMQVGKDAGLNQGQLEELYRETLGSKFLSNQPTHLPPEREGQTAAQFKEGVEKIYGTSTTKLTAEKNGVTAEMLGGIQYNISSGGYEISTSAEPSSSHTLARMQISHNGGSKEIMLDAEIQKEIIDTMKQVMMDSQLSPVEAKYLGILVDKAVEAGMSK